jgi:hypothetical protein
VRVVFGLTVVGGSGLLGLAVWPGLLEVVVFSIPLFCVSLPLLGFWFLMLVVFGLRDIASRPEPPGRRRWWGVLSAGIMFGTIALLWFRVPQRIAFAFCYADLRGLVDAAPADEFRREEIGCQVGPYWVDQYGADQRGGVFFRTATGPDGIGPDQMSYGFAFRPNGQGSPFGNSRYGQRHLFGDWYVFAVSDD